jgi:hypothetical protein
MANKIESIVFKVPSGDINCSLITPDQPLRHLAVVLPGAGYSIRQPLLYFASQVLLQKGFIVLGIEKVYGDDPKWRNLPTEQEARTVVEDDAIDLFKQIAERFPNLLHTVVARSLGTFALACALEKRVAKPLQIVWQTPALGSKWSVMKTCDARGFGILGTADHYFKEALANLPEDRVIIEQADHGMEIAGDPIRSIEILKEVTLATSKWLTTPQESV